jgi:hypothetical protein
VYLEVVEIGEDAGGTMKISAREYTEKHSPERPMQKLLSSPQKN